MGVQDTINYWINTIEDLPCPQIFTSTMAVLIVVLQTHSRI